jgi:thiamine kinase-like enzyme
MDGAVRNARECAIALPCWSGPVDPRPLGGGLSNHNFVVEDEGHTYVVRIGGDDVLHNVMRFNEHACARAAASVDLTPRIVYAEAQALVTDFVQGKTCEAGDVVRDLPRLMILLRRLHYDAMHALRGPVLGFSPFHVVRHYAKLLDGARSRMQGELGRFCSFADEVEALTGSSRTVLCHNDLLAANFIDSGERLWIIDWEHAGFGAPLFDLANLASNNELPEACERSMLEIYFETAVTPDLWRQFRALRSLSHLREAMWSLVSELHSSIDFDFVTYSDENIAAFESAHAQYRAL